jgi:Holliday junction DNA helicase RuvA
VIASLKGVIEYVSTDYAVIDVGGIGFRIFAPTSTLSSLGMSGEKVHIYTHTHVREDAIVLYGFKTPDELKLFQILINVSGFGPKLALAMLSFMDVDHLVSAIAGGNEALITSIPGIGKKLAGRLLLEVKDKISSSWSGTAAMPTGDADGDVMAALLSLGYSANEASQAIGNLPRDKTLTLEEKIKLALGWFSKE